MPLAGVQSFPPPTVTLVWPALPSATGVWHELSITIAPLGEQKEQLSAPLRFPPFSHEKLIPLKRKDLFVEYHSKRLQSQLSEEHCYLTPPLASQLQRGAVEAFSSSCTAQR